MSKILALDTSTQACSIALWLDGEVREDYRDIPRQHTQLLLPMVQQLLADAGLSLQQLDGLAFGRGPGSFTGLRICCGVTQGLALGADLPVAPVSTLAALALQGRDEFQTEQVLASLDARMDEVYWGAYQFEPGQALPVLLDGERVCRPEAVTLPPGVMVEQALGFGSGWQFCEQFAPEVRAAVRHIEVDREPRAGAIVRLGAAMIELGQGVAAEQALPVYLRDDVAKKKGEQVKGQG